MQEDSGGFICPGCGGSVLMADEERRVSCPHCGQLLEVSEDDLWVGEDEGSLELVEAGQENEGGPPQTRSRFRSMDGVEGPDVEDPDVEEFVNEHGHKVRRRKVRKWKTKSEESKFARRKKKKGKSGSPSKPLICGAGLAILVAAGLGGTMLYETFGNKKRVVAREKPEPILVTPDRDEGETGQVYDVPVEKIEEVVRQFLEAKSPAEMARLVRDRERVLPLMREYYARDGQAFRPEPYKAIGEDSSVSIKQKMRAILVTLGDYSQRQIGVEDTGRGFLVDWESWVGYCGMSWDEFARRKPTRPVVFRVTMRRESYYNYDFSDDSKWLCFRIGSLNDEGLWAYASAETAVKALRTWHIGDVDKLAILDLRYPENATRGDQVVIDRFVADGWVLHGGNEATGGAN